MPTPTPLRLLVDHALAESWAGRASAAQASLLLADHHLIAAGSVESPDGAMLEYVYGVVAVREGDLQEAEEHFAEAAHRARAAGAKPELMRTLQGWGEALLETGQVESASHCLSRSLELCEEAGDELWAGRCLGLQARLAIVGGDLEQAWALAGESLGILEVQGQAQETDRAENLLGLIEMHRGALDAAETRFLACLRRDPAPSNKVHAQMGLVQVLIATFDAGGKPELLVSGLTAADGALDTLASLPETRRRQVMRSRLDSLREGLAWRQTMAEGGSASRHVSALEQAADRLLAMHRPHAAAAVLGDLLALKSLLPGFDAWPLAGAHPADRLLKLYEEMGAARQVTRLDTWLRTNHPEAWFRLMHDRFVPRLVEGPSGTGQAQAIEMRRIGMLVLDVAGFSAVTLTMEPAAIFGLLTEMFRILNTAVEQNRGESLRYIGDMLLAAFGAEAGTDPAGDALRCALRIVEDLDAWNLRRLERGAPRVDVGIGVHVGEVACGRIMARGRWEYTVHGAVVNDTAHMQGKARRGEARILASRELIEGAGGVPCRIRSIGRLKLKHEGRWVDACEVRPLMGFRATFVPHGDQVAPRPGRLALGAGGRVGPGGFDGRQVPSVGSSAMLLVRNRAWVQEPGLRPRAGRRWEFVFHHGPAFDACVAAVLASAMIEGRLPRGATKLAAYARRVNRGESLPVGDEEASPILLFMAARQLVDERGEHEGWSGRRRDLAVLERGMHIAQVMLDRMGQTPSLSAPLSLGGGHPFAAEARSIRADADRFEADLGRGCVLELRRRADRGKVPIRLFSIEDSTCGLTAEWAERRGMPAQHIATSLKSPPLLLEWGRSLHGHLVRVVPGAGFTFEGLASALDEAESAARDALPEPFHRVDDPWYDGRRHGYTLVDVPHCSSVLSADEVRAVILRCFG